MADKYTKVRTPSGSYACHDHILRDDAIKHARAAYQHQLDQAMKFLAQSDDEIRVYQCTGLYREKNIRELPPSTT